MVVANEVAFEINYISIDTSSLRAKLNPVDVGGGEIDETICFGCVLQQEVYLNIAGRIVRCCCSGFMDKETLALTRVPNSDANPTLHMQSVPESEAESETILPFDTSGNCNACPGYYWSDHFQEEI